MAVDKLKAGAREAGVDNAQFEVADAASYTGSYDVIAFFEPFANDRLEDNLNPVGRVYYGASTLVCVPVSLAKNGPALGAQAGETRLRETFITHGGFTRFRRATETPFNSVLEARP